MEEYLKHKGLTKQEKRLANSFNLCYDKCTLIFKEKINMKTNQYILDTNQADLEQKEQLHILYSEIEEAERKKALTQACRSFNLFAEIDAFNKIYKEIK